MNCGNHKANVVKLIEVEFRLMNETEINSIPIPANSISFKIVFIQFSRQTGTESNNQLMKPEWNG